MAELIVPPGYGAWSFKFSQIGVTGTPLVTLGFAVDTPPYTQANNDEALIAFGNVAKALYPSDVHIIGLSTLVGNDGPLFRFVTASDIPGTRSNVSITPPNTTYLVKKESGFAGRQYRGRMYFPYVLESDTNDDGSLVGAAQTILNTLATNLLSDMIDPTLINTSELVILHAEAATVPDPTPITAFTGETFVATQRRRLKRG
jgi:hypothetical protein